MSLTTWNRIKSGGFRDLHREEAFDSETQERSVSYACIAACGDEGSYVSG